MIINFMFICAPSIIYFLVWIKWGKQSGYPYKIVLFVFLCISLILCLSFPYQFIGKFFFDFRQVPLVIGVLYGGPVVGGALFAVSMTYRYIILGQGVYLGLLITLGTYISLVVMTRNHRLSKRSKLIGVLFVSAAIIPILI